MTDMKLPYHLSLRKFASHLSWMTLICLLCRYPAKACKPIVTIAAKQYAVASNTIGGAGTAKAKLQTFENEMKKTIDMVTASKEISKTHQLVHAHFEAGLERILTETRSDNLQQKFIETRDTLFEAIDDIEKNTKVSWAPLKPPLRVNNPVLADIENILKEINDKENEESKRDLFRWSSGLQDLDDPLKKELTPLRKMSQFIPKFNFDLPKSEFDPFFVAALKTSDVDMLDLHDSAMGVNQLVSWPQAKLVDRDLLAYLTDRVCAPFEKPTGDTLCAFFNCPSGALERKSQSVVDAFEFSYAWLKTLFTIECQAEAKDQKGKIRCLVESGEGDFELERRKVVFNAKSAIAKRLKQNKEARNRCDCPPGAYQVVLSKSARETKITCKNCAFGSYSIQSGVTSCARCPVKLDGSKAQYEQCTRSILANGPYNIQRKTILIYRNKMKLMNQDRRLAVGLDKCLKSPIGR